MSHTELANLLFPDINTKPEDMEKRYPPRNLPEGAMVTRLGPSPTGFIHLGNLYVALADERMAHGSGGVCILRIEDTDEKREVEGALAAIIESMDYYSIRFDEGATVFGERGDYGPYTQSRRGDIYQCFVKNLVAKGMAYPCFMTEEEIASLRSSQEAAKLTPGIYGQYARDRDLSFEEVAERLKDGLECVIRFKSPGDASKYFTIHDGIRGEISMPENIQDVVILKKNGLPTYHFAHVVDDHLMRITHIVRGEEWLSSLPIHVQLFEALGWDMPVFCHNTVLMKIDEESGQRRKLSKRRDPELSLEYYRSEGYHPSAVKEYLMTLLNSDFEEWRLANPSERLENFDFSHENMGVSGALFDMDKLRDISKEVLSRLPAGDIYDFLCEWAGEHQPALAVLFREEKQTVIQALDIERTGEKPRKDLIYARQIFQFISYFFDEHFMIFDEFPAECPPEKAMEILKRYLKSYEHSDDREKWFGKIRDIASDMGYALKPRDYRKNPEDYNGHVGHVSGVIRIALTGRSISPDIWEIQQIMGEEKTKRRMAETWQLLSY